MYISLNWIKDYVDLSRKIDKEGLGLLLTGHTVEVDAVISEADKYKNVVVGKILEIKKHPNADKLRLAKVDAGSEVLDIVCGAPNIEVGQKVPVALIGAILPNGMEIKEALVRGEKSSGMLCAEDELGLGADHSGIMILDKKAKEGQAFGEYLKLDDVIYEIDNKSITNRPDLWGHYGMAREIALISGSKFKELKIGKPQEGTPEIKIKVEDSSLCPRYMVAVVEGIKVGTSPEWLQKRLIAVGMRPINNIVDITNYVMLELGQPLHAFDWKLADEIVVRKAKEGEVIITLDGEKRKLEDNMLVIADSAKPIAVAGVMGGGNSEISEDTTAIVIESANFEPFSIRHTAQKLGLRTEASMRFEKSLDPNLCETAVLRTIELLKQVCPECAVKGGLVDIKNYKLNQGPIDLDLDWLALFIGEEIEEKKIIDILEKLGFEIEKNGRILKMTVPTWRAAKDISIREDLAEEVARIYGYGNLKAEMPLVNMKAPQKNNERMLERVIKETLAGAPAMSEVYNYSFVGEDLLKRLNINPEGRLRLLNPISKLHTLLRQSLAPQLFSNVRTNQARFEDVGLFEIGSVFMPFDGNLDKDNEGRTKLPHQEKRLGLIMASDKSVSLEQIKGAIEYLFDNFDLTASYDQCEDVPDWGMKDITANIVCDGKIVGYLSRLAPKISTSLGIKKKYVFVSEIKINDIMAILSAKGIKQYKVLAKFPPAIRDIAFVVEEKIAYSDIKKAILSYHEYLKEAELFDIYRGDKLGKNKKSLAFRLSYTAPKTLTSAEVDEIQDGLVKRLEEEFGAQVRDF
jgi:phenylalanyl-tRNA synthetase beta chain